MISYTDALKTVFRQLPVLRKQTVSLNRAGGCFLAEAVKADIDLPTVDNSAMDGYAVISSDTTGASEARPVRLKTIGDVPAGKPYNGSLASGQTLYIATGGAIPRGADAVVPVEHSIRTAPGSVDILRPARSNDHIRFAGEDLKKGDVALPEHTCLGPAQLGMLAAAGATRIRVFKKPEVAFLATGDELVEPARTPGPGQVRNSNAVVIGSMVRRNGFRFKDLGLAGDHADALLQKLQGFPLPEILLTSAGVSVGKYDLVADILKSLGLEVLFWKVAVKPGKPLVFGKIGSTLYFGLPGNPVSAAVVYTLFVEPLLLAMAGSLKPFPVVFDAVSDSEFKAAGGRLHFARGDCYYDKGWRVRTTGRQGSHLMSGMAAANCLVAVPPDKTVRAESMVKIQLLEGPRENYERTIKAFSEWWT